MLSLLCISVCYCFFCSPSPRYATPQALYARATAPLKNIAVMCFMAWMTGNSIQIFSIIMTFSLLAQPLSAILGSGQSELCAQGCREPFFSSMRLSSSGLVTQGTSQVTASSPGVSLLADRLTPVCSLLLRSVPKRARVAAAGRPAAAPTVLPHPGCPNYVWTVQAQ